MNLLKIFAVIAFTVGCAHGKMGNVEQELSTGALDKADTIYVLPIDTADMGISGDKSKDAATVEKIKKELHSRYHHTVVTELRKQGFTATAADKRPAKGKVLEGKVTGIENGSAAARMFVGMGAGSANMFSKFTLTDLASGKQLTRFEVIGTSGGRGGWAAAGSFLDAHITDSSMKTAEYLAKANTGKK